MNDFILIKIVYVDIDICIYTYCDISQSTKLMSHRLNYNYFKQTRIDSIHIKYAPIYPTIILTETTTGQPLAAFSMMAPIHLTQHLYRKYNFMALALKLTKLKCVLTNLTTDPITFNVFTNDMFKKNAIDNDKAVPVHNEIDPLESIVEELDIGAVFDSHLAKSCIYYLSVMFNDSIARNTRWISTNSIRINRTDDHNDGYNNDGYIDLLNATQTLAEVAYRTLDTICITYNDRFPYIGSIEMNGFKASSECLQDKSESVKDNALDQRSQACPEDQRSSEHAPSSPRISELKNEPLDAPTHFPKESRRLQKQVSSSNLKKITDNGYNDSGYNDSGSDGTKYTYSDVCSIDFVIDNGY